MPQGATLQVTLELERRRRGQRDLHQAGGRPDRLGLRRRLPGGPGPHPGRDHPVDGPGRLLHPDPRPFRAGRRHAGHASWPSCCRCRSPTCRPTRGATASTSPPRSAAPSSSRTRSSSWSCPASPSTSRSSPTFVNSTEIIAEFDLTGAPHGLYDVQVTNPDGQMAIAPYRFQVEQTIEPDVTIGVGGPRFILAGDTRHLQRGAAEPGQHQRALRRVQRRHPAVEQRHCPPTPANPLVAAADQRQPLRPALRRVQHQPGRRAAGLEPDVRRAVRHAPVVGRHRRQPTATPRRPATCSTRPRAASPASRST